MVACVARNLKGKHTDNLYFQKFLVHNTEIHNHNKRRCNDYNIVTVKRSMLQKQLFLRRVAIV